MANTIRLDIVTPDRLVYSADVNMVIARATDGDLGILPGHAPLIAGLKVWPLRIIKDEGEEILSLDGGFIEVHPRKITISANYVELPTESRLKGPPDIGAYRAEAALKRIMVRLMRLK